MSAKDRLENWMKLKKVFSTSEVIAVGSKMRSNRADRNKRVLQSEGRVRKLKRSEYAFYGYSIDTREDVYKYKDEVPAGCFI